MKKILKRKNLLIAVMLLCLGLFTSCTLDFDTVKSIEFVNAPAATYTKDKLVELSQFSVFIDFSDDSQEKDITINCDNKLLTITGDIIGDQLDTTTVGLKKITVKYENVSIMVTFEVVDTAAKVSNRTELLAALDEKLGLIKVCANIEDGKGNDNKPFEEVNINYPVHIIGENEPLFDHVTINTNGGEGIYQVEGIKVSKSYKTYTANEKLIEINDNNPFAKVIINNCKLELEKAFTGEETVKINENSGSMYHFISINENSKSEIQNYFNVEIINNDFKTLGNTAVYSAINLPLEGIKDYSRLYVYSNTFDLASRYVLANGSIANLELLENKIDVSSSLIGGNPSTPSGFQISIYNNSLCNIKNNNFTMNGFALNITFSEGSENAVQKFLYNLRTNIFSNVKGNLSQISICSWLHSLNTIDFGEQDLTEEQFHMSFTGKTFKSIKDDSFSHVDDDKTKELRYNASREYFRFDEKTQKYVSIPVSNEDEFNVNVENITHIRINTNISWNIRFTDKNGEQHIEDLYDENKIYNQTIYNEQN